MKSASKFWPVIPGVRELQSLKFWYVHLKIKVSVCQFADICLFSTAQYKCTVDEKESEGELPLGSGSTPSKVYELKPLLSNNKDKLGLALDGQMKHKDTNLASSTLIDDPTQKGKWGSLFNLR